MVVVVNVVIVFIAVVGLGGVAVVIFLNTPENVFIHGELVQTN